MDPWGGQNPSVETIAQYMGENPIGTILGVLGYRLPNTLQSKEIKFHANKHMNPSLT